jgi:predicted GNAT superfamily acetyltransferase
VTLEFINGHDLPTGRARIGRRDANEATAYLTGFADAADYDGEEFGWFRARETGFFHRVEQI